MSQLATEVQELSGIAESIQQDLLTTRKVIIEAGGVIGNGVAVLVTSIGDELSKLQGEVSGLTNKPAEESARLAGYFDACANVLKSVQEEASTLGEYLKTINHQVSDAVCCG